MITSLRPQAFGAIFPTQMNFCWYPISFFAGMLRHRFICNILNCFLTFVGCYMQTLNTGSLFYATLNALAYFYMVRFFYRMLPMPFLILLIYIFSLICPFSGLLLGRVYFYYQPYSNACPSVHCDWSLFFSAVHCLCSTCKYFGALTKYLMVSKTIVTCALVQRM